jgi:hypothetical protein
MRPEIRSLMLKNFLLFRLVATIYPFIIFGTGMFLGVGAEATSVFSLKGQCHEIFDHLFFYIKTSVLGP